MDEEIAENENDDAAVITTSIRWNMDECQPEHNTTGTACN